MGDSAIQWTDKTWNPVIGCTRVSPGCENCYAEALAPRLARMGHTAYEGLTRKHNDGSVNWTGEVRCLPERLSIPSHWRKPARVFVNSMSDLFHESVPDSFIASVWAVMCATPQHTYQILTKRPERVARALGPCGINFYAVEKPVPQPQPNIWIGVSAENQAEADKRVPMLLQIPAAIRFISAEPLLGPIDFTMLNLGQEQGQLGTFDQYLDALNGTHCDGMGFERGIKQHIDWVIAGAESGHGARLSDETWIRSIKDQCVRSGVSFFYKQWAVNGRHVPTPELDGQRWMQFPEVRA